MKPISPVPALSKGPFTTNTRGAIARALRLKAPKAPVSKTPTFPGRGNPDLG